MKIQMLFRDYDVKPNDVLWVSKDMIHPLSPVVVGEYYCLVDEKWELYEDQLLDDVLFVLSRVTFVDNKDRKWYQFWKPKQIINGYELQCIDLEECIHGNNN
jgi:hypothetical protein